MADYVEVSFDPKGAMVTTPVTRDEYLKHLILQDIEASFESGDFTFELRDQDYTFPIDMKKFIEELKESGYGVVSLRHGYHIIHNYQR